MLKKDVLKGNKMKKDLPKIAMIKNGPYKVESLHKFTNSRGEAIAVKPVITLCRCGASQNKPFCDGSHARIGFTDEKNENRVPDKKDTY